MRSRMAGAGGLPAGALPGAGIAWARTMLRAGTGVGARATTRAIERWRAPVELAPEKRFTLYRRERFTLSGVFRVERLCGEMFYIYT